MLATSAYMMVHPGLHPDLGQLGPFDSMMRAREVHGGSLGQATMMRVGKAHSGRWDAVLHSKPL